MGQPTQERVDKLEKDFDKMDKALQSASDNGLAAGTVAPPPKDADNLLFGLTPVGFLGAALFGLVGVCYVVFAKKRGSPLIGVCGVGLMVYTYFVANTLAILAIGAALCALPFALRRAGVEL